MTTFIIIEVYTNNITYITYTFMCVLRAFLYWNI